MGKAGPKWSPEFWPEAASQSLRIWMEISLQSAPLDAVEPNSGLDLRRRQRISSKSEPCETGLRRFAGAHPPSDLGPDCPNTWPALNKKTVRLEKMPTDASHKHTHTHDKFKRQS